MTLVGSSMLECNVLNFIHKGPDSSYFKLAVIMNCTVRDYNYNGSVNLGLGSFCRLITLTI